MSEPGRTRWSIETYKREVAELKRNELQVTTVSNESAESTRRMLQLIDECQDAGGNTLLMIHQQGESLNRTEVKLDEIAQDLDTSKKTLKRIEKVEKFPGITLFRPKNPKKSQQQQHSQAKARLSKDLSALRNASKGKSGTKPKDEYKIHKYTPTTPNKTSNIKDESPAARSDSLTKDDEEIDSNIGHVSEYLKSLKHQAVEMGSGIEKQNFQLDRMNIKAQNNQLQVKNLTGRTRRLLKKSNSSVKDTVSKFKTPNASTSTPYFTLAKFCPRCSIF